MKVKMLISIAGNACEKSGFSHDFSFAPGDTPTLKPELAKAWIAAGHAEAVNEKSAKASETK